MSPSRESLAHRTHFSVTSMKYLSDHVRFHRNLGTERCLVFGAGAYAPER